MKKAKKSLSQNFLKDKNICKKIVQLADITNKSFVLEIGPGYGFMTDEIINKKPKKLYLIEKDNNITIFLKKKYNKFKNIEIRNEDFLNLNLDNFKKLIIISNLPYNVSTKIILYLFKFNKNIDKTILMIQKEVAEKFNYNLPNMNKYKFLTRIVSTYYKCFDVSSNVFTPKPKVKSSVIKFEFNQKKNIDFSKVYKFTNLIFKNIRKKIYKNLNINKKNEILFNKRVNELTIKELLVIYNSF